MRGFSPPLTQAHLCAEQFASGAPNEADVEITQDGSVVSVVQWFHNETEASQAAEGLKDGNTEGHLFNLGINGAREIPQQ
jgi:hypothetical protein